MIHKLVAMADERMKKALEAARRELAGIRTGKATPALLDMVSRRGVGENVSLKEVGQISAARTAPAGGSAVGQGLVKVVAKAIQTSDLGLNPTDDGTVVRIPIPSLTEERRKDMVKLVAKLAEEGRVHVRQVRHDVNKDIKHQQDAGTLSEDDAKRMVAEVQKLTDHHIGQIDELLKKKTAEVMEV